VAHSSKYFCCVKTIITYFEHQPVTLIIHQAMRMRLGTFLSVTSLAVPYFVQIIS